jgi:hypothetical protein
MEEYPMSQLGNPFRWAAWAGDVLSRVENNEECLAEFQRRQEAVDDDNEEAELVAAEFADRLREAGHDPESACVFIPSRIAAEWLSAATRQSCSTNKASAHLKALRLPRLEKTKKDGCPGWRWRGVNAQEDATMARLHQSKSSAAPESTV